MARTSANRMLATALLAALAGCGSGGGGTPDGGGHGGTGGGGGSGGTTDGAAAACAQGVGANGQPMGTVSWVDGGAQCAYVIETTRQTNTIDFLNFIAVSMDSSRTVTLTVATDGTPLGGTYTCGSTSAAPSVSLGFADPVGVAAADTCTITITSAGSATTHAQGTFSGAVSGVGARAITDGVFDVVVTPS